HFRTRMERDRLGCTNPLHQIIRHRARKERPADQHVYVTGVRGKIHCRLSSGIPATDDYDRLTKAPTNVNRRRRVVNAGPLETLQSFNSKLPVVRAGGNDDRSCRDLIITIEAHNKWVFRTVDARHRSANRHGCAELLGLYLSLLGEFGSRDAI